MEKEKDMNMNLEEDMEESMTERQAQRLVEWVSNHGHTKEEAYEALAYVMGVYESPEEECSQENQE